MFIQMFFSLRSASHLIPPFKIVVELEMRYSTGLIYHLKRAKYFNNLQIRVYLNVQSSFYIFIHNKNQLYFPPQVQQYTIFRKFSTESDKSRGRIFQSTLQSKAFNIDSDDYFEEKSTTFHKWFRNKQFQLSHFLPVSFSVVNNRLEIFWSNRKTKVQDGFELSLC